MMNPNERKAAMARADSKPALDKKQSSSSTATATVSGSAKSKSPKAADGGGSGSAGGELSVNPKVIKRKLNIRFEYCSEDHNMYPRFRKFQDAIKHEFPTANVEGEFGDKGSFLIYLNKELWFSKKDKKNYPEEKSLLRSFKLYLETGQKSDIIADSTSYVRFSALAIDLSLCVV